MGTTLKPLRSKSRRMFVTPVKGVPKGMFKNRTSKMFEKVVNNSGKNKGKK